MTDTSTALVLGASRGLGMALAEAWCKLGWHVIGTVRRDAKALEATSTRYPGRLEIETADIADAASVRALRGRLQNRPLDVLFINAGIAKGQQATPATVDEVDFTDMMLTNALGPVRAIELLQDLVPAGGVIAVMSSELGSVNNNTGFWQLYSASKAALNMLMKGFAGQHPGDQRAMLLVAPGWIRTEMGGDEATYSIEETIPQVAEMVGRSRGQPGLRFVDRFGGTLPW